MNPDEVAARFPDVGGRPAGLRPNAWYSFRPAGAAPGPRVGHTATYVAGDQIVVLIGGAVPDGLCRDHTWMLYLSDSTCGRAATEGGFERRYEHCAMDVTNGTAGARLWVFAGADMDENKNDLWEFDVDHAKWCRVTTVGEPPSKRTLHSNAGPVGRLVVFGGGSRGAEAVDDTNVYQLDIGNRVWSVVETSGEAPAPRHGHVLVTGADGKTYIHGGLCGKTFFDDLFILDRNGTWTKPNTSDVKPEGRASHGCVFHNNHLYILGGLTENGVANDFWRIDTKSFLWERVCAESRTFPARLDFAMTLVGLPEKFLRQTAASDVNDLEEINSVEEYINVSASASKTSVNDDLERELLPFIMIHGGMDDKGMIYDDFFVFKLPVDTTKIEN